MYIVVIRWVVKTLGGEFLGIETPINVRVRFDFDGPISSAESVSNPVDINY
jgi:hypothetical protein